MSPPSQTNAEQLSDSEDWSKISDLDGRRKIQNRLAQRSRRKKLKMLESREGTSKRTPTRASKSPEPTTRHTKSAEWPESLRDIKSLLSQIDQTKSRLQEYLSSISTVVQEAPIPAATAWESWSFPDMDDDSLNTLFQGIERSQSSPDLISFNASSLEKPDYPRGVAITDTTALITAPMAGPLLTPPASESSRSCKRNMRSGADVWERRERE